MRQPILPPAPKTESVVAMDSSVLALPFGIQGEKPLRAAMGTRPTASIARCASGVDITDSHTPPVRMFSTIRRMMP